MGQRANLIIIDDGEYTLHYDHWCANRLDEILFWGVGYALDFFSSQEETGEDGWLDDIWAEGGAVLDMDKKHLLWWGGEDILYELPLRRAYLKLQQKIWNGWTIEWAHRGIVDLAEYVGYSKENVLSDRDKLSDAVKVYLAEQFPRAETLGSLKTTEGSVLLFPLLAWTENYLFNGVDLVSKCQSVKGLEKVVWVDWRESGGFPQGGFHLDETNKTLEFWSVRVCPNIVEELKKIWDDWDIVWHRDNYEFQIEKLGDRIVLPESDEADLIRRLRQSLLREDGKSGLESALDVNETLRNAGESVQINPWLFKSHHVGQPLASKLEIWKKNFGE